MSTKLKKSFSIPAAALGALCMLLQACSSDGCMENRNSVPLAGFYSSAGGQKIYLDSVEVTGLGMDVALSQAGKGISQLYLPMRSTQASTTWVLSYKWKELDHASLNDTLTFEYDSEPFFASNDCGVIYKYSIRKALCTTHLIDSVALADSVITNVDKEQIRIYFRTADPDTEEGRQ